MVRSKEAQAVIDALYTILQKELDILGDSDEDICRAFKLASIVINAESGTPLEMLNGTLRENGVTVPLEVYVEQEEDEVDVVTDEGVKAIKIGDLNIGIFDEDKER